MLNNPDLIKDLRKLVKKLKSDSNLTHRRIGEGLETIMQAIEQDGRDEEAIMNELMDLMDSIKD